LDQWLQDLPKHLHVKLGSVSGGPQSSAKPLTQPDSPHIMQALQKHLQRGTSKRSQKVDQSDELHVLCLYANQNRTAYVQGGKPVTLLRCFPQQNWPSKQQKDSQRRKRPDLQLVAVVTGLDNQAKARNLLSWVHKKYAVCPVTSASSASASTSTTDEGNKENSNSSDSRLITDIQRVPEGKDSVFLRSASILALLSDPNFHVTQQHYSVALAPWLIDESLVSTLPPSVTFELLHDQTSKTARDRSPEPRTQLSDPPSLRDRDRDRN
jgi:hypothetical protein